MGSAGKEKRSGSRKRKRKSEETCNTGAGGYTALAKEASSWRCVGQAAQQAGMDLISAGSRLSIWAVFACVMNETRDSTDAALDSGRAASVLMPAKPVVAL